MGVAVSNAIFMRKARRFVASFIPFVLAVSTLSAISIATAPSANGAQDAECVIGSSSSCPATSPQEIFNLYGTITDGTYWLRVNGQARETFLIMNTSAPDGGMWFLGMKAPKGSTTFKNDSTFWTDQNSTTGTTSLSNDVTTDAKFHAFNHLPAVKIVAVFRDRDSFNFNASGSGDLGANNRFAGHTWSETISEQSMFTRFTTNQNLVDLNGSQTQYRTRNTLLRETDSTSGKLVFPYQTGWSRYGFNNTTAYVYRWGVTFNNETSNGSNDTGSGIGMADYSAAAQVSYSDGFTVGPSASTTSGVSNPGTFVYPSGFQIWGKTPNPSLAAPASLAASIPEAGQVNLSWATFSGATDYVVQYKTAAASSYSNSFLVSGQTTASITGLTSSTSYNFRVFARTATNSTSSANIASSTITATPQTTPGAPSITGITAGDTTLSVAFNPPSTDGGAAITNYQYSTDGGSNWRTRDSGTTSSPLVINTTSAASPVTLVNGTTYNVQIRAVNSVGNGAATSSTTGTPTFPTCSPTTNPSPPSGYTIITFTSIGECIWSIPAGVTTADIMAVGGGGGGGTDGGSGGGGGAIQNATSYSLNGISALTISLGAGGTGGSWTTAIAATSGSSTLIKNSASTLFEAKGGTRGLGWTVQTTIPGGTTGTGGTFTAGQNGGLGPTNCTDTANTGGTGTYKIGSSPAGTAPSNSITGSSVSYGGGGGGGSGFNTDNTGTSKLGAAGGGTNSGGRGGSYKLSSDGLTAISGASAGQNGFANTGGGGGAGTACNAFVSSPVDAYNAANGNTQRTAGGSGGSGVVVIRYVSTYTVTYSYNGADAGNSTASTTFNPGGTALALPNPTRTGFTFNGWYTAASGGSLIGAGGANYTPSGTTSAITLEAQWVTPSGTVNVPSAPDAISAVGSNGGIAVTWSQPVSLAGKEITNYQVEYSTTGVAGAWTIASSTVANNATSYTITGLTTNASYYVRVVALFSGGRSAYGYPWQKIYGTITPTRSSGAIVYQSGFGTSAGDAFSRFSSFTRVRYLMKSTYDGNQNFADVDFAKGLQNASNLNTSGFTLDSVSNIRIPSTISGQDFVTQGDVYDLTVLAPSTVTVQNGYGFNGRVEIWPWNYAPEAPTNLTSRSAGTYDDADTPSGSATYGSFQLHNITNGTTNYRQTVLAWNNHVANPEIGFGNFTGANSDWTFCASSCASRTNFSLEVFVNAPVTASSTSDAPTGVTATRGNAQASVSWSAPASNGGSAITGYSVTSSPSVTAPVGCTNTANLSCTFTGLTNGTAYTFTVVAINSIGTSTPSAPSVAVTPATIPGAPTGLTVTGSYKRVSISWTAPTSNGGSAVTGYTVTSSPSVTAPAECVNTASTSCVFTGLTAGTAYTFTVVAINDIGNSLSSSASSSVTPFGDCVVTTTSSGGYKNYVFTTIGLCGWVVPAGASKIDVAAVGGGGGAAFGSLGGGGGGGRVIISNSPLTVLPDDVVIINVGAGGAGGWNAIQANWSAGANGSPTSITVGVTAYSASGGGGGGGGSSAIVGSVGGSGGGGAGTASPKSGGAKDTTVISGFDAFGNNGGTGNSSAGGGGGGAGSAGGLNGVGGNGYSVWGTLVGGGGGGWSGGTGGSGGGGASGTGISTASSAGTAGTDGLGGGGGGGQKGGTGRVMIRFIEQITITPTVSPSSITFGSNTSISTSFTQSLTYTLTTNPTCEIYSDTQRTNKVSTNGALTGSAAAALSVGTYYVNCSGAVATNGPTISYASDATFTINPVVLSPALIPTFGTPTPTSDGFTLTITNYDALFNWDTVTVSAGSVTVTSTSGSNRVLTVTGLSPGASATVTQQTTRSGYVSGSATVSGTAAATVTSLSIGGVTAPVRGATPVTTITASTGYTGTVTWAAGGTPLVGNFAAGTVYTATITLTATAGYTFSGVTADSFTVSGATATNLVNSGVITAVFSSTAASITYSAGTGGSGTTPTLPTSVAVGGTFTTPFSLYTRAGYSFSGWSDGTNTYAANALYPASGTVTGNVVLTAQWTGVTYTVLFVYNGSTGGDSEASKNFTSGGTAMTLPTPTRTGYTFGNWFSNIALTTEVGSAGATYEPAANLTLYAKWNPINYTVTYNSTNVVDGSTINSTSGTVPVDSVNYNIGQSLSIKSNSGSLARTGYAFAGWVTSVDGTGTAVNSGQTIEVGSQNINLYPKWNPNTYTITYNLNGGTGDISAAPTSWTVGNSDVTLPTTGITRTGYTFGNGSSGYWSSSQGGAAVSNSYSNIGNVTLYAIWTVKTIAYSFSQGTAAGLTIANFPANSSSTFGSTLVLSSLAGTTVTISSDTYLFSGWSFDSTIYQSSANFVLSEVEPTFTAIWTRLYDVRYGFAGGTKAAGDAETENNDSECVTSGLCIPNQEITLRGAPTRTGYQFAGWKVQDSATIKAAVSTVTITDSSYLFYAQWTPIDYEFSFNSTGGSNSFVNQTKNIGQLLTLPDPGFRSGYSFAGWSADSGVTKLAKGSTYVVGSLSQAFVAIWTPNIYTIIFDWQGASGSVSPNVSYTVGTGNLSLPAIENRVKDGFNFAGWSETTDGTIPLSSYQPTADRVLYAIWTDGNYLLTLNGNGATVTSEVVAVPRTTSHTLPTRTRPNFKFVGWFDSATGGNFIGNASLSYLVPASQTLYARWVQDSFYGVDEATLETATTFTASDASGIDSTITHVPSGSSARVQIQPGALTAGTVISVRYFKETSRQQSLIGSDKSYFFSVLVSWILGSGSTATVPDTASDKPILVTLNNAGIKAGAMVYRVIGGVVTELQRATVDGSITVELRSDPELVIAATKPTAPQSVAVSSTSSGSSTISWLAPNSNGGSEIIEYTASVSTDSSKSCTTTNLTCTITGLSNGTSYSFVVTATNGVGVSPASSLVNASTGTLYVVTFNPKEGTIVSSGSFFTGSTVEEPTAPTRSGYTFAGWSATDGGSAVTFPYAPGITTDITLFARWNAVSHVVTFDSKSGSTVTPGSFLTGGAIAEPTAPTRAGFTFAGWSATDGGSAVTFPYSPGVVTAITLYAKWTALTQSDGSNGGGGGSTTPSNPAPTEPVIPSTPVKSNVTTVAPVTVVGDKDTKVIAVEIATPPAGSNIKPPSVKVDSASEKFIAEVKVVEGKLVLTPETGFSGKKTVTVTVTENGVDRFVQIPLTVLPEAVSKPVITPTASNKTTIRWTASPNATAYTVLLNGKRICSTSSSSCSVSRILGPDAVIEIISNGGDRTVSEKIEADFRQSAPVAVARLASSTKTKATLSKTDLSALDKVIALIKSQGFGTVVISQITTTKKTEAAAAARLASIKKYIDSKLGSIEVNFQVVPPASRTYLSTVSVKG